MSFVPSHRWVGEARAEHWALVVHGALGSGQNWLRFVKDLVEVTPRLRYALVDVRGHGASQGAPAPHTIRAAAADFAALAEQIGSPPKAVLGHSLGGKLAARYALDFPHGIERVVLLDSNPGAQVASQEHEIYAVLAAVKSTTLPAPSRQAVVDQLLQLGLSSGMAQWLATSLRRDEDGYRFVYDLPALEPLLTDYFASDLWPELQSTRGAPHFQLVVAERSDRLTGDLRERAFTLPAASSVSAQLLVASGHWVHVDNPAGLLALLAPELSAL